MNQTSKKINEGGKNGKKSNFQSRPQETIDVKALYKVGEVVEGRINSFFKAGSEHPDMSAVISLAKGGTALLLYNEMPGYPRNKIVDYYKPGESIEVDVIALRPNKNRISVSLKSIILRRASAQLERGHIVEATIVNRAGYGYFVSLGGALEALLHNDNLDQDFHGNRESFEIGETTEVVVLKVEEGGKRIGVGRRQLFE